MTMFARTIFVTLLILTYFEGFSQAFPTGDAEVVSYKEGPKVSAIRLKLRRLHDLLQDYGRINVNSGNGRGDVNGSQSMDGTGSQGIKDVSARDIANLQVQKVPDPVEIHHRLKPVSAEDMSRRSIRNDDDDNDGDDGDDDDDDDDDEADLDKLRVSSKTKRQQDDSIQILAKALAQLNLEKAQPRQDNGKPSGHQTQGVSKDQPKGERFESSLLDALATLLEDERQQETEDRTMTAMTPDVPISRDDTSAKHQTDDDNDDDDDDDAGDDNDDDVDDLIRYLMDAYTPGIRNDAKQSKAQVMDELEDRLIEEIGLANTLGVSIDDVIQDLEDKAFREALIRRLQRLMTQSP